MLKPSLTLLLLTVAAAAFAGVVPGDQAPDFTLADTDGHEHSLQTYLADGQVVVLEWFNPDCPFIRKHHQHHRTMAELHAEYADRGVVWLAVNSGAEGKQGAGLERNRKAHEEFAMDFPILMDMTGAVGKSYGAKTTPHMFVITTGGKVAYAGAIDDDRSADTLGKVNHVREALEAVLAGKAPATAETQPYGCSVKY